MDNSQSGQPTIYDVAERAGVAASTVSRALSHPDRVSPVTRDRVMAVAIELGYITPAQRRRGGENSKRAVGVVIADVANPFSFAIIQGVQRQLNAAGYTLVLIDSEESGDLERNMVRRARASVDGFVLASTRLDFPALEELAREVPTVTINRRLENASSVMIDSLQGFRGALEHLVSLGHRRVLYVAGPDQSLDNGLRWEALRGVADTHGITLTRTAPTTPNRQAGAAAADAVLNDGATGCIAFNDLMAIGMLSRFRERGIRVPEDISVIGCDGIFGSDFCTPPLTTVVAPLQQAGRSAVALLLEQIESGRPEAPQRLELPTHLAVRQSSGAAKERS